VELLTSVLVVIGFVAFIIFVVPWLFKLKKGYLEKRLVKYQEETGEKVELISAGMPPLKYWLKNRKGDCWGRVRLEDGTEKWVRYGTRLVGPGLVFYD